MSYRFPDHETIVIRDMVYIYSNNPELFFDVLKEKIPHLQLDHMKSALFDSITHRDMLKIAHSQN